MTASMVAVTTGNGGLPKVRLENEYGSAEVYLNGAHVTSWRPDGTGEVFWLSPTSAFTAGRPIRGGVPICFPWFGRVPGDDRAPQHGFARISEWALAGTSVTEAGLTASFVLTEADLIVPTSQPYAFEARFEVAIAHDLQLALQITNSSDLPLDFEAMLHTYFAVSDARTVVVRGLEGLAYSSGGNATPEGDAEPIAVGSGVSRRFSGLDRPVTIVDAGRSITVDAVGADALLWNPGPETVKSFDDFPAEDWTRTLCLETGSVRPRAQPLSPGNSVVFRTSIAASTG